MTERDNRHHGRNAEVQIRSLHTEIDRLREQKEQDDHIIEELKQHMLKLEEENREQAESIEWARKTIGKKQIGLLMDKHFNAGNAAYIKVVRCMMDPMTQTLKPFVRAHVLHHHSVDPKTINPLFTGPDTSWSGEDSDSDSDSDSDDDDDDDDDDGGNDIDHGAEFFGVLGATIHRFMVSKPRPPYTKSSPEPHPSLCSLQDTYLNHRTSYLLIMMHAMSTGIACVPTRHEYLSKPREHRRALVSSGIAADMVEMGNRSMKGTVVPPPFQIMMRDTLEAQRRTPSRLVRLFTLMKVSLSPIKPKHHTAISNAKTWYQYLPWDLVPTGTVVRHQIDNCNSVRTTADSNGSFGVNLTAHAKSIFTPKDLRHLGLYDHLDPAHPYRLRVVSDFTDVFDTNDKFNASPEAFKKVHEAAEARMECAFTLMQKATNSIPGWVEELRGGDYTKEAIVKMSKSMANKGIKVMSLPMHRVKGSPGINGHDLSEGWESRYPRNNEAKLDYTKFNNIRHYDVGHYSVDNVLDNILTAQFSQQELGVGPIKHIATNLEDVSGLSVFYLFVSKTLNNV